MDAIPLTDPETGDFRERWTILVTNGYYEEVIYCKPHVNIVGINKESVYIQPPPPSILRPVGERRPTGANIYLNSFSLLSNVTLLNRQDSKPGHVVVYGFDNFYEKGGEVHDLGLSNVDIMPFSPYPEHPDSLGGYSKASLIRLEGEKWHTAIFRDVGGNYIAPWGYGINLIGAGHNADCHFINCFFDALYLTETQGDCGILRVQDCFEVHLRNSFLRINNIQPYHRQKDPLEAQALVPAHGSAAAMRSTRNRQTHLFVEGSSLECNAPAGAEGLLDIGPGTVCFFKHSSSDSRTAGGTFIPSGPDGIG